MYPEAVLAYSRQRRISSQDAAQTFMQVVALRHVSAPGARLMGGAALVLGYGSPRFSEDVDLAGVRDPASLGPGLGRARAEIEGWLGVAVDLRAPKAGRSTWRITAHLGRSESLSLHVDSQPGRALTSRPLVVTYPSIPAFVVEGMELDEIMAEKVIAAASRRYLTGRDLFDLWFHWLRSGTWEDRAAGVLGLIDAKLGERSLSRAKVRASLAAHLSDGADLGRARAEWERYLPAEFRRPDLQQDILSRCRLLAGSVLR